MIALHLHGIAWKPEIYIKTIPFRENDEEIGVGEVDDRVRSVPVYLFMCIKGIIVKIPMQYDFNVTC